MTPARSPRRHSLTVPRGPGCPANRGRRGVGGFRVLSCLAVGLYVASKDCGNGATAPAARRPAGPDVLTAGTAGTPAGLVRFTMCAQGSRRPTPEPMPQRRLPRMGDAQLDALLSPRQAGWLAAAGPQPAGQTALPPRCMRWWCRTSIGSSSLAHSRSSAPGHQ